MSNKKLIVWVLIGWLVVLGLLALAFVLFGSDDLGAPARHELGTVAETARKVLPATESLASGWQPDAVLVGITASWHDVSPETLRQPPAWSFQFYSAGRRETLITTVLQGQAQTVRTSLAPYPLPAIQPDAWAIDSTQALEVWLDNGGADFLAENPVGAQVRLQLRLYSDRQHESPQLVWTVTGLVFETNRFRMLRIDATSGKVVYF
ncbi:MAG: hypothetical protein ACOYZ7_09155 [Chloroflexota bacterium]